MHRPKWVFAFRSAMASRFSSRAIFRMRALPCQLRISDEGELEILSRRTDAGLFCPPGAQARPADRQKTLMEPVGLPPATWWSTRVIAIHFVGRKSDTINVGGAKVYPADVEHCIGSRARRQQVRVYGITSSLAGQLVAAEVQPSAGEIDQERSCALKF